jgi:hypothetical protein
MPTYCCDLSILSCLHCSVQHERFGAALLYGQRENLRKLSQPKMVAHCKRLKRKKNALTLSLRSSVGPKLVGPTPIIKSNENNMLDRHLSVAPMMDWVESLYKSNS